MTSIRLISAFFLTAILAACGGGGGSESSSTPSPSPSSARWASAGLDFRGASVGSTTVRTLEVTNTGSSVANLSAFEGLPNGVTAEGCSSVAAGAKCSVSFTFKPTAVASVSSSVTIAGATGSSLQVAGRGVDAALQALSFETNPAGMFWSGSLPFKGINQVGMVLKDVQIATAPDKPRTCTVTVQGAYPAELAGRRLEIGDVLFTIPAMGTMSTAGNTTTTTFTQPFQAGTCTTMGRPDPGYSAVLMY